MGGVAGGGGSGCSLRLRIQGSLETESVCRISPRSHWQESRDQSREVMARPVVRCRCKALKHKRTCRQLRVPESSGPGNPGGAPRIAIAFFPLVCFSVSLSISRSRSCRVSLAPRPVPPSLSVSIPVALPLPDFPSMPLSLPSLSRARRST
eukprot:3932537-Rhodomonas_salina.1